MITPGKMLLKKREDSKEIREIQSKRLRKVFANFLYPYIGEDNRMTQTESKKKVQINN